VRKRLSPAQGLIRLAVRNCLTSNTKPGQKLLIAVSGGADSLALAAACEFEAKKLGVKIAAAVIDHSLQKGSDKVAAQTAKTLAALGFEEVVVKKITVGKAGGPEAAARTARYTALETLRQKTKSHFIVLGHTSSDQAETVLLGLVRGSGSKSLSGMSEKTGFLLRPLLGVERATTEAFCKDSGIKYWSDPQNQDKKFLRVMIRKLVLPFLEKQLGGSVAASLVRTSDQLREDNTYLESQSDKSFKKYAKVSGSGISFDAKALEKLPAAILNRVIKKSLDSFGSESSRTHGSFRFSFVLAWAKAFGASRG